MTIALSAKVNDGVVLASDSATTLVSVAPQGQKVIRSIYNNANKVFNLHRGLPIAAMTWGLGNIGNESMNTVAKAFRERLTRGQGFEPDDYSIESVVDLLQNHIEGLFAALPAKGGKDLLGLVVVGYSSGSLLSEEWKLAFRNGRIETHECLFDPEEAGLWWAGRTEALDRLVSGVDERLLSLLPATCRLTQEQMDTVRKVCEEELAAPLIDPAMPIQDVIDLARFLVDVTCCYERFTPGPALVGGPVEIAAVTRYEGFKWVARKHWFSKELNRDDKTR